MFSMCARPATAKRHPRRRRVVNEPLSLPALLDVVPQIDPTVISELQDREDSEQLIAQERFNWENNLDSLDTCDLLFVGGTGFTGRVLAWWTKCPMTHVIVVHKIRREDGSGFDLFAFESIGEDDGLTCVLSGRPGPGVRLVRLRACLEKRLEKTSAVNPELKICIVKAVATATLTRNDMNNKLTACEVLFCGANYDTHNIRIARTSMPGLFGPSTDVPLTQLREYTCTELAARALQFVGVFNSSVQISDIQLPRNLIDGTVGGPHYGEAHLSDENLWMVIKQ